MLKNIDPSDKSIRPFKVHKKWFLNQNDSGSGFLRLNAESGSLFNFNTGSAASQSFGRFHGSSSKFEYGTYYDRPNWFSIKHLYYENLEPYRTFGGNNYQVEKRELHSNAKIFTIPQELFGEELKPGSINLDVTNGGKTYQLRDDGDGNIYDFAHSASFAAYKSSSFDRTQGITANGSGSQVGNAFYSHGLVVLTDTGSLLNAGDTTFDLNFQATQTIYEYEYLVTIEPGEFNLITNKSATENLSGSINVAEGSTDIHKFFAPSDQPTGAGTGSYKTSYTQASGYQGFVSHSDFKPYVTTVGLYNDNNELLVIGKLAKPIKLGNDINTSIVVRFDV